MLHVVKGTPPAEEDNGGRQEVSSTSIAANAPKDKGRSVGHPTWYRVGCAGDCDIYWHPAVGVAMEVDHRHLVDYAGRVTYFVNPDDYRHLADDVAINPALIQSMPEALHLAFIAKEEEAQQRAAADWADTQVKDEMRAHVAETEVF
jgi:hypothetical protein